MNKLILIFLAILLSCSKNSENIINELEHQEIIQLSSLRGELNSNGFLMKDSLGETIDTNSFEYTAYEIGIISGEKFLQKININNTTRSALSLNIFELENKIGFSLINSCENTLSRLKRCQISILIDSSLMDVNLEHYYDLSINGDIFQFKVVIEENSTNTVSNIIQIVENNLIFGELNNNETKKRRITLVNKSRNSEDIGIFTDNLNEFSHETNCTEFLNRRSSCYIDIIINSDNKDNGIVSGQIVVIDTVYNLEAMIENLTEQELINKDNLLAAQSLAFLEELNLGELSLDNNHNSYIIVKNTSRQNIPINLNYSSLNYFSINSNCPEVLTRLKSCKINISINSSENINVNENIYISGVPIYISAKIVDNNYILDESCGCYKNVPYVENDNILWNVDNGFIISEQVSRDMEIHIPQNVNGQLVVYLHPVGETRKFNSNFELELLNELLNNGFTVASVNFRHPIMEREFITNVENSQWDIILAIRKLRKDYRLFNLNSPNDINIVAYSKGSLSLANILSDHPLLNDEFGFINLKKMYMYDAQITYNLDIHYDLFTGTEINPVCFVDFGFGCISGNKSPKEALIQINGLFNDAGGMKLTTRPEVIDAYRNLTDSTLMTEILTKRTLPLVRFAYNQPNVGKRSPQYLANNDLSLNYSEVDYLIHNPLSIDYFCNGYNLYNPGSCSGNSFFNFNYSNVVSDILNFLNN